MSSDEVQPLPVSVNDIVQIDPDHDSRFGACLMVVTEVRSWGVQGYVTVPAGGLAFYRCAYGKFVATGGVAVWIDRDRSDETPDG